MTTLEPKRTDYSAAVRALHADTPLAAEMGVTLTDVQPGRVTAEMELKPAFTQQHGFAHAGTLASLADMVCGSAAYSLMPEGAGVMSININLSLLRPGKGHRLRAEGWVVKAGHRIYFTEAEILADDDFGGKPVARATATMTLV